MYVLHAIPTFLPWGSRSSLNFVCIGCTCVPVFSWSAYYFKTFEIIWHKRTQKQCSVSCLKPWFLVQSHIWTLYKLSGQLKDSRSVELHCWLMSFCLVMYRNSPNYWDRQALANSVDPDQTSQNAASDQGLHCLPLVHQNLKQINR